MYCQYQSVVSTLHTVHSVFRWHVQWSTVMSTVFTLYSMWPCCAVRTTCIICQLRPCAACHDRSQCTVSTIHEHTRPMSRRHSFKCHSLSHGSYLPRAAWPRYPDGGSYSGRSPSSATGTRTTDGEKPPSATTVPAVTPGSTRSTCLISYKQEHTGTNLSYKPVHMRLERSSQGHADIEEEQEQSPVHTAPSPAGLRSESGRKAGEGNRADCPTMSRPSFELTSRSGALEPDIATRRRCPGEITKADGHARTVSDATAPASLR
jgi:hypothetical protein